METLGMILVLGVAPIIALWAMYQEVMDDEKQARKQNVLTSKEGK